VICCPHSKQTAANSNSAWSWKLKREGSKELAKPGVNNVSGICDLGLPMHALSAQIIRNNEHILLQDEMKSVGDNLNPASPKNMVSHSPSIAINPQVETMPDEGLATVVSPVGGHDRSPLPLSERELSVPCRC
jgi:hypothetical protein